MNGNPSRVNLNQLYGRILRFKLETLSRRFFSKLNLPDHRYQEFQDKDVKGNCYQAFKMMQMSTPMDTSEKLMLNNGQAISFDVGKLFLEGYTDASKKQTCITSSTMEFEFVALPAAATLAKAYSQMYNGKSRHLDVRHSMIHELIMNGVVSIEFMRSQQNLVDHLT
ncbi:hypothetical protein Tco_1409241 [Tanacetum coccineum]